MPVNMTMAIADEDHAKMKKYPEIKWTEIARGAIKQKIKILETTENPLRQYSYKRLVDEGEDADKLFKFWTRRYCNSKHCIFS